MWLDSFSLFFTPYTTIHCLPVHCRPHLTFHFFCQVDHGQRFGICLRPDICQVYSDRTIAYAFSGLIKMMTVGIAFVVFAKFPWTGYLEFTTLLCTCKVAVYAYFQPNR